VRVEAQQRRSLPDLNNTFASVTAWISVIHDQESSLNEADLSLGSKPMEDLHTIFYALSSTFSKFMRKSFAR
jgi:hypothetical protein